MLSVVLFVERGMLWVGLNLVSFDGRLMFCFGEIWDYVLLLLLLNRKK